MNTMDLNSKTPTETLTPPSSPSQFTFTITRTAVSQICQYIGFKGSNVSALQTLTHIATIYLQTLAKLAASHATNSNRTDSNLFDLIIALEDLASVQGFPGASDVRNKSLLSSTTMTDLMNFINRTDELPFAKPFPWFNSSRRRPKLLRKKKNVSTCDYIQRISHVPQWLPPFPDPSTYEIRREIRISNSLRNCVETVHDFEQKVDGFNDSGAKRIISKEEENGLPEKRGRVRFKMGMKREEGLRVGVGVCRDGKRICLEHVQS